MKSYLALAFMIIASAAIARAAPPPAPAEENMRLQAVNAQLDRALREVKFEGVSLSDAVDFLRDVSGANLFVDWKHLEQIKVDRETPVKYQAKNEKFRDVLQNVLDSAAGKGKAVILIDEDAIILTTKEGAPALVEALKSPDTTLWDKSVAAAMDRQLPEVTFDGVGLSDVVDFMKDVSGMKIDVDWDAFQKEGIKQTTPVTSKLRNIRFGQALHLVFLAATDKPIEISEKGGVLHVSLKIKPAEAPAKHVDK